MTLTVDPDRVKVSPYKHFTFDVCEAKGYGKKNKMLGQVKPLKLASQLKCLTASTKDYSASSAKRGGYADTIPKRLYTESCSSSADSLLTRQWFEATLRFDNSLKLELIGNPNDAEKNDYKPEIIYFDDDHTGTTKAVAAGTQRNPSPMSLVLYDLKKV